MDYQPQRGMIRSVSTTNMPTYSATEFAERIKRKYPQYAGMDDRELAEKVVAKYPQYKDQVRFDDDGAFMNFAQGIGKSAVGLLQGVGSLGRGIQRGIASGVEAATGIDTSGALGTNSPFDRDSEAGQRLSEIAAADATGEKVGKFAGDVASFAVPGGAAAKATRGAGLVRKMVALGGTDAAVQTAQQGTVDRNTFDAAILGALFPVASALKGAATAKLPNTKEGAATVINSLVKPLLKDFSYGKNPGRAVAEEGITASSLDELAEKISTRRQEIGAQIGELVDASSARIDASDVLTPLDEAIKTAEKNPRVNKEILNRLRDLKDDLSGVRMDDEEKVATRLFDKLSARDAFELKQDISDLTRFTGNASDDKAVNAALKRVYGNIKKKLNEAVPEAVPLNEKYADLASAEIATKYREKINARQNMLKFGTRLSAFGSLIAAGATGDITPFLWGGGVAVAEEIASSPAAKTRFAKWLAGASKEQKRKMIDAAPALHGLMLETLID